MQKIVDALNLPLDKLSRIVKPWEIIKELTSEIAEKCGLIKGIPIAAGAGDYLLDEELQKCKRVQKD